MDYIIGRLTEGSTWAGISTFLTGIGVAISPELWEAIVPVGLSIAGAVAVFSKEKGAEK